MQKIDCRSACFNANGFHIAAEGQLGVLDLRFEFGIIAQSGYYHVIPQFDTHDEATQTGRPSLFVPTLKFPVSNLERNGILPLGQRYCCIPAGVT